MADIEPVTTTSTKKRKISGDERLHRNRERNKIHARKTRERKKLQTIALQKRIDELKQEGARLRVLVDETYIAGSLLGLRDSVPVDDVGGADVPVKTSASICRNFYELLCADQLLQDGGVDSVEDVDQAPSKRIRRTGRYDPQERDKIRRERNKMHAKKTREKKKYFFERSDKIISEMEHEANLLREYLISVKVMTRDEDNKAKLRDLESKEELDILKMNSSEYEDESEENETSPGTPCAKATSVDADGDNGTEFDDVEDNDKDESTGSDEKLSNWSSSDGSANTTKEDMDERSSNRKQHASRPHKTSSSSTSTSSGSSNNLNTSSSLTSEHLFSAATTSSFVNRNKFNNGFYGVDGDYQIGKNFLRSSASSTSSSSSFKPGGFNFGMGAGTDMESCSDNLHHTHLMGGHNSSDDNNHAANEVDNGDNSSDNTAADNSCQNLESIFDPSSSISVKMNECVNLEVDDLILDKDPSSLSNNMESYHHGKYSGEIMHSLPSYIPPSTEVVMESSHQQSSMVESRLPCS
mmetsp:Transcript_32868/g.47472  ORF Transcript_32868/g.47472 Transcript_32868/m.47472 type:complete len:525 (+) Transcript_32868:120-1694(+)